MSNLVTILNKGDADVVVTVQAIKDEGRELHVNGESTIKSGKSKDFLIDEEQSLRIAVAPESDMEVA